MSADKVCIYIQKTLSRENISMVLTGFLKGERAIKADPMAAPIKIAPSMSPRKNEDEFNSRAIGSLILEIIPIM